LISQVSLLENVFFNPISRTRIVILSYLIPPHSPIDGQFSDPVEKFNILYNTPLTIAGLWPVFVIALQIVKNKSYKGYKVRQHAHTSRKRPCTACFSFLGKVIKTKNDQTTMLCIQIGSSKLKWQSQTIDKAEIK
jgi:hypothetical protein